jgi:hypothetical protein
MSLVTKEIVGDFDLEIATFATARGFKEELLRLAAEGTISAICEPSVMCLYNECILSQAAEKEAVIAFENAEC